MPREQLKPFGDKENITRGHKRNTERKTIMKFKTACIYTNLFVVSYHQFQNGFEFSAIFRLIQIHIEVKL